MSRLVWCLVFPFLILSCTHSDILTDETASLPAREITVPSSLYDIPWILVTLNGMPPKPGPEGRFVDLMFQSEGSRFSGWSGCNHYFGTFEIGAATLSDSGGDAPSIPGGFPAGFGDVGSTKRFCPGGSSEMQLLQALGDTAYLQLGDENLILLDAAGRELARFRRKE